MLMQSETYGSILTQLLFSVAETAFAEYISMKFPARKQNNTFTDHDDLISVEFTSFDQPIR
jgi:hypothetical protein